MTMAAGRIGRLVGGCVPIISRVLKRERKSKRVSLSSVRRVAVMLFPSAVVMRLAASQI